MFKRGIVVFLFGQIMIFVLMVGIPSFAQSNPPLEYDNALEPENVLVAYFNAINVKDYARAFSYWESEPNGATLDQFAAGYNDTEAVEAFFRLPVRVGAGAGNLYAEIPTIFIATHTDETIQYFAGCYVVHATNVPVGNNPLPDPNWYLQDASVVEAENMDAAAATLDDICQFNEIS